jgi:hypothetical protein
VLDYITKPSLGNIQILFRGLLRFLLESMKNVNTFLKLCQVDNAVFAIYVNPDFSHVRTDALHRFPVDRILALLDKMKLKTGSLFNLLRKCGDCFVTIADPE